MDSVFPYSKYVTGKHFLGRTAETRSLVNLLPPGENVVIYEPPKTGKKSLVQQALFNRKVSGAKDISVHLSLLDIRSLGDLTLRLASAVLRTAGDSPAEYAQAAQELLGGTHLVFDAARYDGFDEIVSSAWPLDKEDLRAAFLLPYRLGVQTGERRIVVLDETTSTMPTSRT